MSAPGPMVKWLSDREKPETLDMILQRVAEGDTLRSACRELGWPHGKVIEWLIDDGQRCDAYRRAKYFGAHADVDLAREIALASGEDKLKVDTLWRGAEANAREVFGRQLKVEKTVSVTADAGLVGFAGALLERLARPKERVIEHEAPRGTLVDAHVITEI